MYASVLCYYNLQCLFFILFQGLSVVREIITKGDVQHLRRLLGLKNPNLVPIWKMNNLDSHSPTVEIVSTIIATLVVL